MPMQWTAIILAGQRPGIDPLAAHFGQEYKALVPIDGEAMLTHVVRSLHQCGEIGRIVVLGQQPQTLATAAEMGGGGEMRQSSDGISKSLEQLMECGNLPFPWLVTTADHPLLTPAMVQEFIKEADGDLSIGMVEKQAMLAQFPDAKRTWLRFSDGAWSGANLFAFTSDNVAAALRLWAAAEQDRKQAWKLFRHFGPILALRALTRTIGLKSALEKAGTRLGLSAHLVSLSDPVAAIDVDKPADHALAVQIIASRKAL
ncbi:nucleotidyltransferase family protein [Sphingorhabdus arenilitoris]|uniref:Nucleotidyltransferase family protein n=1 Tax=Sphingorhabdus arenilitoris TaxID=1490041 RepID=A0ABV8RDI0_9SPHN